MRLTLSSKSVLKMADWIMKIQNREKVTLRRMLFHQLFIKLIFVEYGFRHPINNLLSVTKKIVRLSLLTEFDKISKNFPVFYFPECGVGKGEDVDGH